MTSKSRPSEPGGEAISNAPDWVPAEMPPGYQTRLEEIRRLSADLEAMDPFGRLLWAAGPALTEAVRDAFLALGLEAALMPDAAASGVIVKLNAGRLLTHVAPDAGVIRKKSADLSQVFQMMQELAEDADRVVLVANSDPATRPADRAEGIEPDALAFLQRMGANFLASPTVFRLWMLSLHDQARARDYVERLHAQDGGIFLPPPS